MILSIQSFFGANGANWAATFLPLTIMAVMAAMTIHTILYIAGRSFNVRSLEAFAKSEMLQTGATAFMAIFLVAMVAGAMELAQSFISGEVHCGTEPIEIGQDDVNSTMDDAYDAIRCRMQEKAVAIANIQSRIMTDSWTAAQFNLMNTALSVLGVTIFKGDWVPSLYQATEKARIANNLATVLLIGLNAQSALLDYIQANMLHVFIPLGIFLRSFFFTRPVGALFIAVGVGMYFIFPIFYVLLDPGFVPAPPPEPPDYPFESNYCYATMTSSVTILKTLESGGLGSTAGLTYGSIKSELTKSYMSLILHPLIAFFMTMVFIRYMMSILGGDTYELTKMVSKVV